VTVTDLTFVRTRQRARREVESERVAELRRMLNDPRWSADVKEIQAAIDYLTATSTLAA
jgi:hypothetical protein